MAADIEAALRDDPWLVNWKDAAAKSVSSSFRTSYIKAEERIPAAVEIPCEGPWISASPFAGPETWPAGIVEIPLGAESEAWVSAGGILMLSKDARLWAEW
jgi:hypothetical protein